MLAGRVVKLLGDAGIAARTDATRGFDHGTFVPLKVSWPNVEVPTIRLSLKAGLDPDEHLAIGRALQPLRDEGVLILGSGMSYHNLRILRTRSAPQTAPAFDAWLTTAATAATEMRSVLLRAWDSAPGARDAHPREEYLLPLMVVAGAAGHDRGSISFSEDWMGAPISAFRFG